MERERGFLLFLKMGSASIQLETPFPAGPYRRWYFDRGQLFILPDLDKQKKLFRTPKRGKKQLA